MVNENNNSNLNNLSNMIFSVEKHSASPEIVSLAEAASIDLKKHLATVESAKTRLRIEKKFTNLLMEGNYDELMKLYKLSLKPGLTTLKEDELELAKRRLAVFASICSRELIKKGLTPETVMSYEYVYTEMICSTKNMNELLSSIDAIIKSASTSIIRINRIKHIDIMTATSKYIKDHISDPIYIEDVARYVGLSSNYFSSLFKKEMHTPFSKYVNETRINEGKKLLRNTSLSITEIALKVGFKNQNYFTTIFKKHASITPKQYRQRNLR